MKRLVCLLILFVINPALADLPLTIEDLLTAQNRYKLEYSLNYSNSDRRNITSNFDLVETSENNFVLLPVNVGEQRVNADFVTMSLGGRYGVNKDTEIFTRLVGSYESSRLEIGSQASSRTNEQLNDWVIGVNYRFSPDTKTPAFLGFAEITVAENTATGKSDFVYAKTEL